MATEAPEKTLEVTEVPDRDGDVITGKDKQADIARIAQQEESRRDMVDRIAGIDAADQAEIMFQDTSPPRPMTILYATLDGEPVPVTRKRARLLLQRKLADGQYMFIAPNQDGSPPAHLPEYRQGSVKCFMHKESEERKLLDSLGMAGKLCIAGHLANIYAKRIHERKCHKREREMYQDYLDDKKEEAAIERQEMQYTAMMALA
ncbi:hypothetical protein LCGC14_2858180, partial [marine sediment metagenome]